MKKIIGFFGGDSQVGTTMIAQSLAELLQRRGQRVLYIMGSGKFGEEFLNLEERHSLDDLKAAVRSGRVSAEDLFQNLEEHRGMWVLPSVRNPLTAKFYTENTYEILLAEVMEEFDYAVIDGGDNGDLGLTISALNMADDRYFVTTQQSKAVRRMILMKKNIAEPLSFNGTLVINKYIKDPALLMKNDVLALCEEKDAVTIPYIEYSWQAELENRSLLHYSRFSKAMELIAGSYEPPERKEGIWKKHFL